MSDDSPFSGLKEELDGLRNKYSQLTDDVRAAEVAYNQALRAYEVGKARRNHAIARVNAACSQGEGLPPGTITVPFRELLDREEARYRAICIAYTKARNHLSQLTWERDCLDDDIAKLSMLVEPRSPPLEPAAPRSRSVTDADGDFDIIQFPSGRAA